MSVVVEDLQNSSRVVKPPPDISPEVAGVEEANCRITPVFPARVVLESRVVVAITIHLVVLSPEFGIKDAEAAKRFALVGSVRVPPVTSVVYKIVPLSITLAAVRVTTPLEEVAKTVPPCERTPVLETLN